MLVKLCLSGHATAWEVLVQRYKRLVYGVAVKVLNNPEDRDEVFQETFISLYKQLDRLERVDNLSYWLAKVAERNTWKTLHRRRRSENEVLPADYEVEDPEMIPAEKYERTALQATIRQAVVQLSVKCQAILNRLFYESDDSDYKVLADELGISIGSIGPTRNRCLVKLKKILEKSGIDENYVVKWLGKRT